MKELLMINGWVMYYKCTCNGGRQHWKHNEKPGYEVRTKARTNTFTILLNNRVISGPSLGNQLDSMLKQYT